jgi:HK97 gp10 family phage protein
MFYYSEDEIMSWNISIDTSEVMTRLERILSNIEQVPQIVDEDIMKGMENMVIIAQGLCPIDTGRLRDSIRAEGAYLEFEFIADAQNEQGEFYGGYVEYGTSRAPAQPFMWPAIEAVMVDLRPMIRMHVAEFIVRG